MFGLMAAKELRALLDLWPQFKAVMEASGRLGLIAAMAVSALLGWLAAKEVVSAPSFRPSFR